MNNAMVSYAFVNEQRSGPICGESPLFRFLCVFFFRRNVKMTCNTRHILCLLACLALKQHLLLYFLHILLKWPTKYTINDFVFSEISENSTKILKIPRRDTVTVIFRRPHLFEAVQQSAVQQTVDAFSNVAMRDALCSL